MEKIFAYSVSFHGKDAQEKQVLSDTTVQENNTTYPTDAKLAKKIIDKVNQIAQKENVEQRQTYTRVSKQLVRDTYNPNYPKRAKKSKKKLKTIARRLVREIERELSFEQLQAYQEDLILYKNVLVQK